ncbi:dipeptidase 2 [Apiospora kogelbergensis]|uniref:Dipeptidase n=1 Tax=Apiospora kogelbergensis TaxID=1337665 RepID=A0AAW0QLZ9_9PEZI
MGSTDTSSAMKPKADLSRTASMKEPRTSLHVYRKAIGAVDFPRLREGRLGAQFWSAYVECPREDGDHSDSAYREIVHDTLQQIDLIHRLVRAYPSYLTHAYSAADVRREFLQSGPRRRISSLLGIEGLHQIGNSASILRMYYALGVRYATLTHTCHNAYADSEEPAEPLNHGLSLPGRAMVKEMNRLGMMVDLSHTSFETQRDVLRVTEAPVIFFPLQRLFSIENGGLVMIIFYASFLENDPSTASLGSVADHIQAVGETIGYRHVGIGSDFDGMESGPRGLEDVSKYPDLVRELQRRGIDIADIAGIMGSNVLRVMEDVENIATSMRHILPLEDDVKSFFEN